MSASLNIVFIGLSITSAWGNCHAAIYRSLTKGLWRGGHRILFLEWDAPWYRQHRDLPASSDFCEIGLYDSLETLKTRFGEDIRNADVVIVGSYTYEGIEVGRWVLKQATGVTAFYDIDTPMTLVRLRNSGCGYISTALIPQYDFYLSAVGGPVLRRLETAYGAKNARSLYCSVDPDLYFPDMKDHEYALGYLGTYSVDRQPALERFLIDPALRFPERRFAVAGANYPAGIEWPKNVAYKEYLPPVRHRWFYNLQQFSLNITRPDVMAWGYSPCLRMLEAAACGVPVISDYWMGLETFFQPGSEIITVQSTDEVIGVLEDFSPQERITMGARARSRVLENHTGVQRAQELIDYLMGYSETANRNSSYLGEFVESYDPMQEQLPSPM